MAEDQRERSAEDLVLAAIKILQRGLPGRDLDDKGVVIELWGIFDSPSAREIYNHRAKASPR